MSDPHVFFGTSKRCACHDLTEEEALALAEEGSGEPREAPRPPGTRRCRIDLFTPAERAIYDAVGAVEAAGCDERLTRAVTLLADARAWVADFVDGVDPADHYPRPAAAAPREAPPREPLCDVCGARACALSSEGWIRCRAHLPADALPRAPAAETPRCTCTWTADFADHGQARPGSHHGKRCPMHTPAPAAETPPPQCPVATSDALPPGTAFMVSEVEGPDGQKRLDAVRVSGLAAETPTPVLCHRCRHWRDAATACVWCRAEEAEATLSRARAALAALRALLDDLCAATTDRDLYDVQNRARAALSGEGR